MLYIERVKLIMMENDRIIKNINVTMSIANRIYQAIEYSHFVYIGIQC